MPGLAITPNIEAKPWEDLKHIKVEDNGELAEIERIGRLPRGTDGGRSTVCMVIHTKGGKVVIAQTTMRLMHAAMRAMQISAQEEGETFGD